MFRHNLDVLPALKYAKYNLRGEITINIHGKILCFRTNNRRLTLKLVREYLPFFKIVPYSGRKDFMLDIIFGFQEIDFNFNNENKFDQWDFKNRTSKHDNFYLQGDKVFYYQKNVGIGFWDKTQGRLMLIDDDPVLNSNFKYFFYTVLFDWLSRNGYFLMHGCGLEKDGKGILILGSSSAGKSTLAFNFLRKNFNCLGDNAILIKKEQGKFFLLPFLKYISLKDADAQKYPECIKLICRNRAYRRKYDKLSFKISDLKHGSVSKKSQLALILCPDLSKPGRILTKKVPQKRLKEDLRRNIEEMVLGISCKDKINQINLLSIDCAKAADAYYLYTRNNLDLIVDELNNLLK